MKPCILLLTTILISACAPIFVPATATPTSTNTPSPTTTFTPSLTATITLTPTPSLPPEIIASIGDRPYELRADGHYWVKVGEEWQDWFQKDFTGENWRKTDWKLIQDAPVQDWWSNSISYAPEFDQKDAWLIMPEPDNIVEVRVLGRDGLSIVVNGIRAIVPDKNNSQVIHSVIYHVSISDSTGWFFDRDWKIACRSELGCGDKPRSDQQYSVQFKLYKVRVSQYPITDRLVQVSLTQGFADWIRRMYDGEINIWPDNLIWQGGIVEAVKSLKP